MAICPGLFYPAAMRDGYLLRIRRFLPALSVEEAQLIADLAKDYAGGLIELTRRGNIQLRGLSDEATLLAAQRLTTLPFMATNKDEERRFDCLVDPLVYWSEKKDPELSLAQSLTKDLLTAPGLDGLSPKFSLIIAREGRAILGLPYDLALILPHKKPDTLSLYTLGQASGWSVHRKDAATLVIALARDQALKGAHHRLRHEIDRSEWIRKIAARSTVTLIPDQNRLSPPSPAPSYGGLDVNGTCLVHLPLSLGLLQADQLRWLADQVSDQQTLTLTPWASFLLGPITSPERLISKAKSLGFADPEFANKIKIKACVGYSGCPRTKADCRGDALSLVHQKSKAPLPDEPVTIHFSGCPRGCAGRESTDLLLLGTGEQQGYHLFRKSDPATNSPPLPASDMTPDEKKHLSPLVKAAKTS